MTTESIEPELLPATTGRAPVSLTARVPLETLQRMQDRFSALVGVSICTCDAAHRLLTAPTWASRFLQLLTATDAGRELCHHTVTEIVAAAPCDAPFSRRRGLGAYASPVVHDGRRLATIVIGARPAAPLAPAEVRGLARDCGADEGLLLAAAAEINIWTPLQRQATYRFVDYLAETVALLYAQADEAALRLEDIRTVHDLTQLLSGTRDLQEILNLTLRRIHLALNVKACGIRLLDADTGELVIKAVYNLSNEYLNKGRVLLDENEIDRAAFRGEAVYIEDVRTDPRIRFRESSIREGIVSGLCVPMTFRGRTVGVVRIYTDVVRAFRDDEVALVRSIGAQAAAAIVNAQFYEEHLETERMLRQIEYAGTIQRRMIPAAPPPHPRLDIGCVYAPTLEVGGDFYDFIETTHGRLGVAIADVVGKGVPAALLMAAARATLRAHARSFFDVDEVIAFVNRQMCRDTAPHEFATVFYGVFNQTASHFVYCNAGHEAPVLLRGGEFTQLTEGGMLVGVQAEAGYQRGTLDLRTGDTLIFATDGTIEAVDFHGRIFSRPRFRESMLRYRALPAEQMARQLLWDVRRFVGLAPQSDDIAIVVIHVR